MDVKMKDVSSKTLMTEGSIWKKMVLFAFPLMLGNLFQQLYNTADSLIVGNFLGSNALAAVSSSSSLIQLLIGFFQGLSIGAGVVISQNFGARNKDGVERAVHTSVAIGLLSGVILTAVGILFAPQILIWMDTPKNVLAESVVYFRIYFWGILGFVMYNVFVGILRAIGDSKHPLYYLMISSVMNVVLDVVFIAVFHMGVGAAALATTLSQFASAFLCLIQLIRTKEDCRVTIKRIRFDREMVRQILGVGIPSGIQNSITAVANVVVQSNINAYGEMAMAGCGAFSKIEGFAFMPIMSFNMAITTFVGQNLGAKEYERTEKGARFGILSTMVLAEIVGIITFIFAPALIAAFDRTPEVIVYGVGRARTEALFFFLLAFSHSVSAVLRGAGKSTVPMMVMVVFWCVIRVAILAVGRVVMPSIQIVYWVYPITWALSTIAFIIYYKKADWIGAYKKREVRQ